MEAIVKGEIISNKIVCRFAGVLVFLVLTSLGAFVRIPLPFTPVPITLQTFFVLLSGAFLGGNLGAFSQFSYALLGILGLPIFSGAGSGLFYLLGPTGGYILGFVLASYFVGRFIKYSQNNLFSVFALFVLSDFILLLCGMVWLKLILGCSFTKLLFIGFIPFLPGDLIKSVFASVLFLKAKGRLREIF
jgi:biotin transport system substrate-specific component